MNWIYEQFFKEKIVLKKKSNNNYNAEYKRLKFCEACRHTWEKTVSGAVARYNHLSTYGLIRRDCDYCSTTKGLPII